MNIIDIINKKRLGKVLNCEEIEYIIKNYSKNKIKDYQMSSLLMAILLNNMNEEETVNLTKCMLESGDRLDLGTVLNKIKQIGETEYRIMIYYLEGNTYAQIGEKMNMKPKSVSNYIQKIRFKLRNN